MNACSVSSEFLLSCPQANLEFLHQASRPIPGSKGMLNATALKQGLLGQSREGECPS